MSNEHGSRMACSRMAWNLNNQHALSHSVSSPKAPPRFSAAAAEKAVDGDFETKFMPTVKACACATDGT